VIDTPISEGGFVGAGVGAALVGKRPIVDLMFLEFLGLVVHQFGLDGGAMHYYSDGHAKVPLVVRAKYGVGPFHGHAYDFHSWLLNVPGVKVVAPSNPIDAKGLMKAAVRDDNPVLFLEHMALYHAGRDEVPDEDYVIPLGRADVKRPGRDATIVASAMMVKRALAAAQALAREGIEAEVVDLRTILPLDRDTVIASVRRTGRLVIACCARQFCGSHRLRFRFHSTAISRSSICRMRTTSRRRCTGWLPVQGMRRCREDQSRLQARMAMELPQIG
jgi:pyruvate dehydrogenase E1 component beta subunit